MRLSEIFEQLTVGELSNVSIGGNNSGFGITADNYPKVIPHINLALTELHKRFPLKMAKAVIQQYEHISTYYLDYKYAESNTASTEPIKYLIDSEAIPFESNILKIENVYNELNEQLCINNPDEPLSLYSNSYNSLMVPLPDSNVSMTVEFRAAHRKIDVEVVDPEEEEVELPLSHLEPLLYYVAGRLHSSRPMIDGINPGDAYVAKFELACQRIENLFLLRKESTSNKKILNKGWA